MSTTQSLLWRPTVLGTAQLCCMHYTMVSQITAVTVSYLLLMCVLAGYNKGLVCIRSDVYASVDLFVQGP